MKKSPGADKNREDTTKSPGADKGKENTSKSPGLDKGKGMDAPDKNAAPVLKTKTENRRCFSLTSLMKNAVWHSRISHDIHKAKHIHCGSRPPTTYRDECRSTQAHALFLHYPTLA